MIVETVRLSEKAKNQLIQIRRKTGIDQWNVVCRWALMLSLREEYPPPKEEITTDSNIEIAWRTFSGSMDPAITALVRYVYHDHDKQHEYEDISDFFKLHLHRGISYLAEKKVQSMADLYAL